MTPFALHDLHDRAAERAADEVAFIDRGVGKDAPEPATTTRADAVARIAAVAGALRELGVERGDRVAVRWPTSTDAHVAVAAALRLGAIAVLVDPRAPSARTAAIVATTEARALVTDRLLDDDASVVAIAGRTSTDRAEVMTWADATTAPPVGPATVLAEDPAYVLTTSGSTGEPKAIVHTHRSGLRYAQLAAATYDLGPHDVVAHVPPLHFDQSTFALFCAPLAGAAVAAVPDVALRLPAELPGWIAAVRPTVWYSVPTILTMLADRANPTADDLASLRWVLFGGEVPGHRVLRELMGRTPAARWSNVFGPAETNHCAHHHFDEPPADGDLPFGTAWDDTELRLVDEDDTVLEGPATGELQIRSATTMAGYWCRPDLDAGGVPGRARAVRPPTTLVPLGRPGGTRRRRRPLVSRSTGSTGEDQGRESGVGSGRARRGRGDRGDGRRRRHRGGPRGHGRRRRGRRRW